MAPNETPPQAVEQLEFLLTVHPIVPNQPLSPVPPQQPNDQSSSPWEIWECRLGNGGLLITWVRQTSQPLHIVPAMEAQALPPPEEAVDLETLLHQQAEQLDSGLTPEPPPVPPSLPHYAHSRLPAAAQQNYARARGGHHVPPAPPNIGPTYTPPATVAGVPGLPPVVASFAEAAVKPCSAPIPPMPTPGGTPPLARVAAQATVAVSPAPGRDMSGTTAPISEEVSVPRAPEAQWVANTGAQPISVAQAATAQHLDAPVRNTQPPLHPPTIPQGVKLYRPHRVAAPVAAEVPPAPPATSSAP